MSDKTHINTETDLPKKLILTKEFKNLFNKMENDNENMFITGKAGCGKSTLLEYFRQKTKKNYVILAPTGLIALKAKGKTIHSFFGFPPRFILRKDVKTLNHRKKEIVRKIQILLIDEASMIRADLFDAINQSLKINRKNNEIFGGVQLILFGDLFQLPPVVTPEIEEIMEKKYPKGPFFFNANVFKKANIKRYELSKIFRQKNKNFINLLNEIRIAKIDQKGLNAINQRTQKTGFKIPKGIVILSPTNAKVDRINIMNLNKINSKTYEYKAEIEGDFRSDPVSSQLKLKVGAQVIITKNDINRRWVNGDIAEISKLQNDKIFIKLNGRILQLKKSTWKQYEYYLSKNKIGAEVVATFTQYPLKLAWAATIHKCQGQTFQKVVIDLDTGTFSHGQTYVALSRATSLKGLFLTRDVSYSDFKFDNRVYHYLETSSEGKKRPGLVKKLEVLLDRTTKERKHTRKQPFANTFVADILKTFPGSKIVECKVANKMKKLHLVCRNYYFIEPVANEEGVLWSGKWSFNLDEAKTMVGGMLFFHNAKRESSYEGGKVLEVRNTDHHGKRRVEFKFQSMDEAKGAQWEGDMERRAVSSGILTA